MISAAPMVAVTFHVKNAQTVMGQNVYVVGDDAGLGKWEPQDGVVMVPFNYPNWQVTVNLTPSRQYQFKFVKVDSGGNVIWESPTLPNREFTAPATGSAFITKTWDNQ